MDFSLSIYGGVIEQTSTCIISFQKQNRTDTWLKETGINEDAYAGFLCFDATLRSSCSDKQFKAAPYVIQPHLASLFTVSKSFAIMDRFLL